MTYAVNYVYCRKIVKREKIFAKIK